MWQGQIKGQCVLKQQSTNTYIDTTTTTPTSSLFQCNNQSRNKNYRDIMIWTKYVSRWFNITTKQNTNTRNNLVKKEKEFIYARVKIKGLDFTLNDRR
jgi:hypothetical protein